jgi:hypothetical protein
LEISSSSSKSLRKDWDQLALSRDDAQAIRCSQKPLLLSSPGPLSPGAELSLLLNYLIWVFVFSLIFQNFQNTSFKEFIINKSSPGPCTCWTSTLLPSDIPSLGAHFLRQKYKVRKTWKHERNFVKLVQVNPCWSFCFVLFCFTPPPKKSFYFGKTYIAQMFCFLRH